jgi:hypothetical protein
MKFLISGLLGPLLLVTSGCDEGAKSAGNFSNSINHDDKELQVEVKIESPSTSISRKTLNLEDLRRKADSGDREALDELYVHLSMEGTEKEAEIALGRAADAGSPLSSSVVAGKLYSEALSHSGEERRFILNKAKKIALKASGYYPNNKELREIISDIERKEKM